MFGALVDFQKNKAVSIFCSPFIVAMGMCIFCNLTNSGLLTIGRHYTLTGSSAFLLSRTKSRHRRAYHPQLVAVYHQCEALYIIIAKEDTASG